MRAGGWPAIIGVWGTSGRVGLTGTDLVPGDFDAGRVKRPNSRKQGFEDGIRLMYELTIHTREGRELKRYELSGTRPIRIGRAVDCDIQIAVPEVSRRHAELIQVEKDVWIIKDLDSTHGCMVNGERIRELTIQPGLEVTIGPAVLRFDNLTARIGRELDELIEGEEAPGASPAAETLPVSPDDTKGKKSEGSDAKSKKGLARFGFGKKK